MSNQREGLPMSQPPVPPTGRGLTEYKFSCPASGIVGNCGVCHGKAYVPGYLKAEVDDAVARLNEEHGIEETALKVEVSLLTAERDKAQSLNEYFRDAVGECHLMISRGTSEYQVRKEWEATELPPRLQKIMAEVARLREERDALTRAKVVDDLAFNSMNKLCVEAEIERDELRAELASLRATLAAKEEQT